MRAEGSQPRAATSPQGAQPGRISQQVVEVGEEDTGRRGARGPSSCLPGPETGHWRKLTGNPREQCRGGFPGASPSKVCGGTFLPARSQVPSCSSGAPRPHLCTFPSSPPSLKQPLSLVQSESESALKQLPLNASSSEPKHPLPRRPPRPVPRRPPSTPLL